MTGTGIAGGAEELAPWQAPSSIGKTRPITPSKVPRQADERLMYASFRYFGLREPYFTCTHNYCLLEPWAAVLVVQNARQLLKITLQTILSHPLNYRLRQLENGGMKLKHQPARQP